MIRPSLEYVWALKHYGNERRVNTLGSQTGLFQSPLFHGCVRLFVFICPRDISALFWVKLYPPLTLSLNGGKKEQIAPLFPQLRGTVGLSQTPWCYGHPSSSGNPPNRQWCGLCTPTLTLTLTIIALPNLIHLHHSQQPQGPTVSHGDGSYAGCSGWA